MNPPTSSGALNSALKETVRDLLRRSFDVSTVRLDRDHRDGLRILAKIILGHRWLVLAILCSNLLAAVFEGSTIGLLVVAVNVLVGSGEASFAHHLGAMGEWMDGLMPSTGRESLFLWLVALAMGGQVLKSGLTYLGSRLTTTLRYLVAMRLNEMAANQIMSFSYGEIGRHPAGYLTTMINHTQRYVELVTVFNQVILALFMFAAYFGLMMFVSLNTTVVAVLVLGVMSIGMTFIVRKLQKLGREFAAASLTAGRETFEYLQAPRLLRIVDATGYARRRLLKSRKRMLAAQAKAGYVRAAVEPIVDAVTVVGAGAFLIAGFFVAGDRVDEALPRLLVFLIILNRMMPQVKVLNSARMAFGNLLPIVQNTAAFLRTEDKEYLRRGGSPVTGVNRGIEFRSVFFAYPDAPGNVLEDINFSLEKGRTIAVVGASGAGKSTLADLLLGLYEPTSGEVLVDGASLSTLDPGQWRRRIGVVDQDVFLLNASIRDNIAFARGGYGERDIEEAARAAHAHDFIRTMPAGYATEVGDRGFRLSGGQQQRLALARALLGNPEILILDEATSALDTESEKIIQDTLEELHSERTMLIIAHRLSTIAHANEVIVLERGRIIERGTSDSLLRAGGKFAKLWNLQSKGPSGWRADARAGQV